MPDSCRSMKWAGNRPDSGSAPPNSHRSAAMRALLYNDDVDPLDTRHQAGRRRQARIGVLSPGRRTVEFVCGPNRKPPSRTRSADGTVLWQNIFGVWPARR